MIKVNLLSPERKEVAGGGAEAAAFPEEQKESKISTGAIIGAAAITVGIIGFMYVTQAQTLENRKNLLDEKNARKAQLKDVESTLAELERTKKDLTRKVALIGQLKSQQYSTVKMMDEISNALPEWVWLSDLHFSGNRVNLNGKAIHNNLIADFINNLKATNSFTDIQFQGSTKRRQKGVDVFNFKLNCIYVEKKQVKKEQRVN